ncbi:MAG TPA: ABC transporter ATP-binding protein [Candidatus Krumholzibacterium sp.]|nr:ABC transporter ATP-binding protein [Candidatus Krumholzibacterium sp.]
MIEVREIKKHFGDVRAVDGISFSVGRGEVFGLLGPNGAGKTTTISMLSGLLKPDSGSITVSGIDMARDSREARAMMGIIPQEIALYDELSGRENLHFWGGLYGLSGAQLKKRTDEVLEMVGLTARADDAISKYSGGMKRRINLCAGLIHGPGIILLDEPTLGIDPQARNNILDIVKEQANSGTTVIYTTHYLEEAEMLCDRIAIMDDGRIFAEGSLEDLIKIAGEEQTVTVTGDLGSFRPAMLPDGVRVQHMEEGTLRLLVRDTGAVGGLLNGFYSEGMKVETLSIREPGLQGVFLKLTGRELRD